MKNVSLSTLLLLKLGDQMLCPYIIQTASNCVALKAAGDRKTRRMMQQPIHQFKEEKTLIFVQK